MTKDASCPAFTTLSILSTNSYKLYIAPSSTGFSFVGLNSCKLILTDGTYSVERTLSFNVLNTAPYFYSAVSSKRIGVDGQMTIDLYSKFYDNE